MTDDDRPIGSVLTRREALALLGAGGLTALHVRRSAAQTAGTATCVARPALTEGPFFVDEKLNRSDIRSDPATAAFDPACRCGWPCTSRALTRRRLRAAARRDRGRLALRRGRGVLGREDPGGATLGQKFLRGYQATDAERPGPLHHDLSRAGTGAAAVHIHFKIRSAAAGGADARLHVAALLRRCAQRPGLRPAAVRGARHARHARTRATASTATAGAQLTLAVTPAAPGYAATFELALETG